MRAVVVAAATAWAAVRAVAGGAEGPRGSATAANVTVALHGDVDRLGYVYAKTRLQFGRPIGSYQAIKHKCADILVEVEFARSAAYNAAFSDESDIEGTALAASMAKSWCSEAYFHAANENIQIHGGMGFTWEHDAHLYFKRAKASEILFGSPVAHRERVAAALGIAAA